MVYGIVKFIFIVHHNFGRAVRNPIKHNTTYLEPWRLVSEKGGGGGRGRRPKLEQLHTTIPQPRPGHFTGLWLTLTGPCKVNWELQNKYIISPHAWTK